jgi:hypothetical protein
MEAEGVMIATVNSVEWFYQRQHEIAERCLLFHEFVEDGLTREELEALIEKRPSVWGMFSEWLENLPSGGAR